jgi:hypothetical protein
VEHAGHTETGVLGQKALTPEAPIGLGLANHPYALIKETGEWQRKEI